MIFRYFFAWFGMMVLAIANGGLRDYAYKSLVGDLAAHQISTVVLIIILAGYIRLLTRIWPIRSKAQAWIVGGMWFVMTEVFEFGMGLAAGDSWDKLLHAYDISAGQVWIFVPLWVLAGPYLFFRFGQRKKAGT